MRGAGRIGGKNWKVPPSKDGGKIYDPFGFPEIGYLPVAPTLEPINENWSISNFNEPVDPRDCSKYPASPYCGEFPFRFGSPVGFDVEIRTNGCETCLYVYPVVAWMKLTPTIICYRDPKCSKPKASARTPQNVPDIPDIPDGYYLGVGINRTMLFSKNGDIQKFSGGIEAFQAENKEWEDSEITIYPNEGNSYHFFYGLGIVARQYGRLGEEPTILPFYSQGAGYRTLDKDDMMHWLSSMFRLTTGAVEAFAFISDPTFMYDWGDWFWSIDFALLPIKGGDPVAVQPPTIKPPPPPPPLDDENRDRERNRTRKRGDDMCCNDCRDSSEKSDKLLREIKEIKRIIGTGKLETALDAAVGIGDGSLTALLNLVSKRIGTSRYPIEVPASLLTGVGDEVLQVQSLTDFQYWFVNQIDALVGEFPIEIEVKDIDPLKEGDQKKSISLPNIAEAIAEIYGLSIKNSVNQEVEINMLLRLAAEIIATKNGVVVAQDYARANAGFLGYKGNYKARELVYNFDFGSVNLDPKNNQPIILEKLLKTTKGFVQGWELEDKETVVGFLQKLMFSAGIIKAVFFRGKNLTKQLNQEATSMANDEKTSEKDWQAFLQQLNNPNSMYNKDSIEKPEIREEPKDPRQP